MLNQESFTVGYNCCIGRNLKRKLSLEGNTDWQALADCGVA